VARSVLDLLLEIQLIDDRQHESVLSRAKSAWGGHLIQTTCELGYATESSIVRALSAELGLQRADLAATPPEPEALALVDAKVCRDRFILPMAVQEDGALLLLAMADPTDADTIGRLGRKLQKRVRALVAGPTELTRAIARLYAAAAAGKGPAAGAEDAPSPLARIAAALGVRVPQMMQRPKPPPGTAERRAGAVDRRGGSAVDRRGGGTAGQAGAPNAAANTDTAADTAEAGGRGPGGQLVDDLSTDDLETLEALRASLDKGAVVLRAIGELCVEKGFLTAEEAARKP
jgi:hypothetical protein